MLPRNRFAMVNRSAIYTAVLMVGAGCDITESTEYFGGSMAQMAGESTANTADELDAGVIATNADAATEMGLPDADTIPMPPDADMVPSCEQVRTIILSDHVMGRHALAIEPTDIDIEYIAMMASMYLTYPLQGMADHDHTIELNPFHAKIMLEGRRAMISSTSADGHRHFVELTCP
ncbi:MAG: hypothetical protein VX589_14335 [Myxococcota bacterium]|nr:hypothetical protein [Myxococcota bacterium]